MDNISSKANISRYDVEKKKWDEKAVQTLQSQQDWRLDGTYDEVFSKNGILKPVHSFFSGIGKPGVKVLDCGCGNGWTALLLATKAESVSAFDISEGRIAVARQYIHHNRIGNLTCRVADFENLPYESETFDYIFGNAIIHHVRLDESLSEVARVLKKGGRAAFCEPMAHNPIINLYRYIKHNYIEKEVGTDRPLTYSDIRTFEKYFSHVEFRESSFLGDRYSWLIPLEQMLLKFKFLRRYVCYVTILLEK